MSRLEQITEFIQQEILEGDELKPDDILFSSQRLDSMDLTTLIVYIEDTYNIKVSPLDIVYDNFDSVNRIDALIESKML